MAYFDTDRFIEDCRSALKEASPQSAVRNEMTAAILVVEKR
ncbi:MAG: hypothetical protein O7G87_20960 [bacterium]|nr:hypothetical protein [bacterium]